jgi:tetratricopeptide (TPR) repeat protein
MNTKSRAIRKKLLREAEGYIDLAMAMDDRWPLGLDSRTLLSDRAIEALDCLARAAAETSIAWYLRGQAHRVSERYSDAIDCLRKSLELNSDNIGAYLALGWCFKRVGKVGMAIEALEAALETGSEVAMVHYNLACYWALVNKGDSAAYHLGLAIDLNPDYRNLVATEHDFDLVRHHPDFQATVRPIVI